MSRAPDVLIRSLFFFFNAVFAFCMALYIHELGHAVAVKSVHGYWPSMTMNPLAGGYVTYYDAPATDTQRLWISSAGILLGLIVGACLSVCGLRFWKSIRSAGIILLGVVAMSVNSLMLTLGYFLFGAGDIHRMVDYGFPVWLSVMLGIAGLVLSGYFLVQALPYFGLDAESSMVEKYVVLGSGVLLYGCLVLIVALWRSDSYEFVKKLKYVGATLAVLFAGLWGVDRVARRLTIAPAGTYVISWRYVLESAVLAGCAFWFIGR